MLLALASCGKREPPPHLRLYGPASGRDTPARSSAPFNGDPH
jgi:hypothetical protein